MPDVDGRYTMGAVARLTGLSPATIRAWERRYGAVEPGRSAGSQRLYGDADVQRLELLRRVVDLGHGIGQVAGLSIEALHELSRPPAPPAPDQLDLLDRVLAAVRAYDYLAADRELGRAASLMTARQLVVEVGWPLMARVGELWRLGELEIGQEHLVSSLMRTLLGTMLRLTTPARPGPPLVLATLEDETHELGLLMVGLLATSSGVPVCYLGPGCPLQEIVKVAERTGAAAVGLSLVHVTAPGQTVKAIARLADALPPGMALWLGGSGVAALPRRELPARAELLGSLDQIEAGLARLAAPGVRA